MLTRHWNSNKSGFCRAPCCPTAPGTLEHLLALCPALSQTRERMFHMWMDRSVMFPTLHASIKAILATSDSVIITQFVLEPLAFPFILADFRSHGEHYARQLSFLTRTFAFYIHRDYQKLLKKLNDPSQLVTPSNDNTNDFPISVPSCEPTNHSLPLPASWSLDGATDTVRGQSLAPVQHSTRVCDTTSTMRTVVTGLTQCGDSATRVSEMVENMNISHTSVPQHDLQTGRDREGGGGVGAWADLWCDSYQHDAITNQNL